MGVDTIKSSGGRLIPKREQNGDGSTMETIADLRERIKILEASEKQRQKKG